MEERVVFPAALNTLQPQDWADIALKLADRYDTFHQLGWNQSPPSSKKIAAGGKFQ